MKQSKIEWTDHSWNPWLGCTKVSDGCKHCYAEAMMDKRYGKVKWGSAGTRLRTSAAYWKQPPRWNRQAEQEGRRYRVFCGSLCDVFEDKPNQPEMQQWQMDLCYLIELTPCLDWLLLTKRPGNVKAMWPRIDGLPSNVWIGASIENQETADERIPPLLRIPAAVRFLSCEPLLGPISIGSYLWKQLYESDVFGPEGRPDEPCDVWPSEDISWVICGGESGPNRRPMNLEWARSLRDQCGEAGVAFFMKQIDKRTPIPDDLFVREFPQMEVTI